MGNYQGYGLEGASAVDLVVALYDGIIRFLYSACDAVERGDTDGRRAAAKRALDIIIHLQSRLRMDVGGKPAIALSEFYAAIFAQIIQASQSASSQKFQHAISCVRNVRDAWRQVAADPSVNPVPPQHVSTDEDYAPTGASGSRWNA
jgi:flagellar secretion chaperone FliS